MTDNMLELPESVSRLSLGGRQIYIVGTAHLSRESVEDVRRTIEAVRPESVCVELCQGRYDALVKKDAWKRMNIFKIIRQKKTSLLLAQLIVSSFYRKLGQKLGVQPGAEMTEGAKVAEETGAKLVLADREIQTTLKRVWGYAGFWTKLRLAFHLMAGILLADDEEISEETIEKIKRQDQLEWVLAEFAAKFPQIKQRLLDERDVYLSQKIREAPGAAVVAVVGAGHVEGIKKEIQTAKPVDELMELPPKAIWPRVLKWAIPAAIIALVVWGSFKEGGAHTAKSIYIWIVINGGLSALGAMLALAHPLTVLSAFLGAPITSLNPMIGAGWVAALVQAWVKKPTVADFEDLPNATSTIKGFWKNPVTKILLVAALANLGSVIGTFVAGSWVAARSL
ncbi:MAG: TraB/GumN family protein [Phycisphaerales bacterium]|nr:MAG: TraB/GumN family protein [Phycisphaerales bacterium]